MSLPCEAHDDGNGGRNYLTRAFSLTETRWSLEFTLYGKPACTYGLISSAIEGPFTLCGAAAVAGAITPVPGGVGAMTIICLMHNTLIAACAQNKLPLPQSL